MTKSTTKVGTTIENERGKVKLDYTLTYGELGEPFADAIKSDCDVFILEMEKKYMPERFHESE